MTAARISVNGTPRELPGSAALSDVVAGLTAATSGVAVAVNGEVVPRSTWAETVVRDGDAVEVVTAVQGG